MLRYMLLLTLATPLPFVTLTAGLQDSLDAVSLVGLHVRYGEGETNVWSTVSVPDPWPAPQKLVQPKWESPGRVSPGGTWPAPPKTGPAEMGVSG
jgi:hypothetical protein